MTRPLHAASIALVAAGAVLFGQSPKLDRDWPNHGHDPGAQRYSPLKQINTRNVSNLALAWTYDTPAPVPPTPGRGGAPVEGEGAPAAVPPAPPARGDAVPASAAEPLRRGGPGDEPSRP